MVFSSLLLATVFSLAPGLDNEDSWPEFRGPTGQGLVLKGHLPTEWRPSKNVAWKKPIPGKGWSSPILFGGRLYLTTAVPVNGDQSLRVLCLAASSGNLVWDQEVFHQDGSSAPGIHGKNSHASPTPIAEGQRLYVHFGHQGTACLDLDGKVLWRNASLKYQPVHGNGGSPIVADDLLVFSCDGGDKRFIAALDKSTGETRWVTDRDGEATRKFSFSTPVLVEVKGQKQIISPGSNSVNAYDLKTGREVWHIKYDGYSVIPKPVVGHGLVYVCTGFGLPNLLAIRPDGQGDVTATHVVWRFRKGVPYTSSPLLVGDEIYFVSDNGLASCLDAKSGRVHWQERIDGAYSASPVYADGKIYFQSEKGVGVVLKAGKKFEILARNPLEERTLASYAVGRGALYVRTEKQLYRFQAAD